MAKNYICYLTNTWREYVRAIDLDTGVWGDPIDVASAHAADVHNYPSILMDLDGYLHLFYGCHNSPLYYKRSVNPNDETAWGSEVSLASGATYPKALVDSQGDIYVFYRSANQRSQGFRKSSDNGVTWGAAVTVIFTGINGHMVYVGKTIIDPADVIHLIWTRRIYSGTNNPAYFWSCMYAKSDDGGVTWKKSDGSTYTLPITYSNAEFIASGQRMFSRSIAVDGSNNPRVLYMESDPSVYFTRNYIHYCYLSGGVWQDTTIPGQDYALGAQLIFYNSNWYVFTSRLISGHFEVVQLKSTDGGANWTETQLTTGSSVNHLNVVASLYGSTVQLVWSSGNYVYYMSVAL